MVWGFQFTINYGGAIARTQMHLISSAIAAVRVLMGSAIAYSVVTVVAVKQ